MIGITKMHGPMNIKYENNSEYSVTVSSSVHNMIYPQKITCSVKKWMGIIQSYNPQHAFLRRRREAVGPMP